MLDMLGQHIITKPVFDALFENSEFVKNNAVSKSMEKILSLLDEQAFEKDHETLEKFYASVKERVEGIDNAEGKQKIIVELYDKFFKTAMPKTVEKLGIVYTPVEVVDFIIHSVADVLKKEFNRSLSDENIHILDPFTGTGTFITRLLQSGFIKTKDLKRKYEHEIHANEILLLAYYIASVNIENTWHDIAQSEDYTPFTGICLTDTFQLGETDESEELFSSIFPQNSERVIAQKKAPLRIIIGNPPYSVGQKSANDNAQNLKYTRLDGRVADTYVAGTQATNKNSLYDTYIKAFRWASDRLDPQNGGIIGFVSNGSWLDGNAQDGFRKCLEKEFTSIYIFNLRGNCRTSGELRRKEAGNVFGLGSRTPISITILVKNPKATNQKAEIRYKDIGDYLNREQKLEIISKCKSVYDSKFDTQIITPNEHGDWLSQRNDAFNQFIPMGDKETKSLHTFFVPYYSNGLKTQRDAWCYNFSKEKLAQNMSKTVSFYQIEAERWKNSKQAVPFDDFISYDATKISWSDNVKKAMLSGKHNIFSQEKIFQSFYRPFSKSYLYYSRFWNERVYQQPKIFPTNDAENMCICISGLSHKGDFNALMTNQIPDLGLNAACQCFPLYWYEKVEHKQIGFFDTQDSDYIRHDGVTDFILNEARQIDFKITKEDIFYYVYGFLHSPEYRETFAADLKKMLPRIPLVEKAEDFWAFSKEGRALADLHLNYETVEPFRNAVVTGAEHGNFHVEKMRFKSKDDKSTILFNPYITVSNIPLKAYDYVVNGRSAIEWVMERYQIKIDKDSQIKNDPNDWAAEHNQPRYILDLLLSVITVSIKTLDIIDHLPKLDFKEK